MPVVIAELISRFSADTGDFESGSKRVQAGLGAAETAVRSAASAMALIGREIKAAGAEFGSISVSLAAASGQAKALAASMAGLSRGFNPAPIRAYGAALSGLRTEVVALGRSMSEGASAKFRVGLEASARGVADLKAQIKSAEENIKSLNAAMAKMKKPELSEGTGGEKGKGKLDLGKALESASKLNEDVVKPLLDAAKASKTFEGSFGGALEKVSKFSDKAGSVLGAISSVVKVFGSAKEAIGGLSAALGVEETAAGGAAVATGALDATLLPEIAVVAAVAAAVYGLYKAYQWLTGADIKAEEVTQADLDTNAKAARTKAEHAHQVLALYKEIETLTKKTKLSEDEQEHLKKIQNDLSVLAPELAKGYTKQGDAIIDLNGHTRDLVNTNNDLAISANAATSAQEKLMRLKDAVDRRDAAKKALDDYEKKGAFKDQVDLDPVWENNIDGPAKFRTTTTTRVPMTPAEYQAGDKNVLSAYNAAQRNVDDIEKDNTDKADRKNGYTLKGYQASRALGPWGMGGIDPRLLGSTFGDSQTQTNQSSGGNGSGNENGGGSRYGGGGGGYERPSKAPDPSADEAKARAQAIIGAERELAQQYRLSGDASEGARMKDDIRFGRYASEADQAKGLRTVLESLAKARRDEASQSLFHKSYGSLNNKHKTDAGARAKALTFDSTAKSLFGKPFAKLNPEQQNDTQLQVLKEAVILTQQRAENDQRSKDLSAQVTASLKEQGDAIFNLTHSSTVDQETHRLTGMTYEEALAKTKQKDPKTGKPLFDPSTLGDIKKSADEKDELKGFDKLGQIADALQAKQAEIFTFLHKDPKTLNDFGDIEAHNFANTDLDGLTKAAKGDPKMDELLKKVKELAAADKQYADQQNDQAKNDAGASIDKAITALQADTAKKNSRTPEDRIQAMVDAGMAQHEKEIKDDPEKEKALRAALTDEAHATVDREQFDTVAEATRKLNEQLASFGKQSREARIQAKMLGDGIHEMKLEDAVGLVNLEDKVNQVKAFQDSMEQLANAGSKAFSDTLQHGLDHRMRGMFGALMKNVREQIQSVLMEIANAKIKEGLDKLLKGKQEQSGQSDQSGQSAKGKTEKVAAPVRGAIDKLGGAKDAGLTENTKELKLQTDSVKKEIKSLDALTKAMGGTAPTDNATPGKQGKKGTGDDDSNSAGDAASALNQLQLPPWLSQLLSVFSMIPGFADGGSYGSGPMIVGERGPELMVPSGSGRVISNSDLSDLVSGGGGHGDVHVHNHFHGPVPTDRRSHDQIAKHTYEAARKAQWRYR
jgi:hypothetical protein